MCYNKGKIIPYQQPFITKGSTFNMETEAVVPPTNGRTEDGSYQKLFSASVIHLKYTDQLDISFLSSAESGIQ
jgi:hypothetical protein